MMNNSNSNNSNSNNSNSNNSCDSLESLENNIIVKKPTSTIEEYIAKINETCEKTIPLTKKLEKLEKIDNENIIQPTINNYDLILHYNYNSQQLKDFARHHKLKITGNKKQLINRIYTFLKLSSFAIKIQSLWRGKLQQVFNKMHGPAYNNRKLCTNNTDFFTMDELKDLPLHNFFSYKDVDGFIYGFDIISIYNLIYKSKGQVLNPYNRNEIPLSVIGSLRRVLRIGRTLNIIINTEIKDVMAELTSKKNIELRALDLFQNIDALGNYSNAQWYLTLNRLQLIKFLRELMEIWNYRAQLTIETKKLICPPHGSPFRNICLHIVNQEQRVEYLQKIILEVMEKLVNSGIDKDSKSLGAYYVLGALTLVNESAATSLPWLFQSVAYF